MIINKFPIGNNNKKLPRFTYTGTYTVVDDGDDGWRIKFLTSGTFKIQRSSANIDVFLVGGGASGTYAYYPDESYYPQGGGGAGSGYTLTQKNINIVRGGIYAIIVGEGGLPVGGGQTYAFGNNGGNTAAFGYTVGGGSWDNTTEFMVAFPGNGGSAGGKAGSVSSYGNNDYAQVNAENGHENGEDSIVVSQAPYMNVGKGQGTTTREFGEETGDLYAGGGGGGAGGDASQGGTTVYGVGGSGGGGNGASRITDAGAGAANTGGGGGGGHHSIINGSSVYKASGAGGSGIVIIRNHRGN